MAGFADRDGELSNECAPVKTVPEEKKQVNTESDGSPGVDEVCEVVENTKTSAYQDTRIQSQVHGTSLYMPLPVSYAMV